MFSLPRTYAHYALAQGNSKTHKGDRAFGDSFHRPNRGEVNYSFPLTARDARLVHCGRAGPSLRSGQALSEANGTPELPLLDSVPPLIELVELGLVVREIDHFSADEFRHHVRLGAKRHAVED